ncbi:HU family DNA-binding protein [Desulfogranum japonicum]|uniref:HU family DNA-binding protein n=1 Tax=Desulfogranum japonicum TaxID=231447 RepID=UPI0022B6D3CD|nr:HU family DNA-binding protein [Desulfogranum japonicum]
MILAKWLSKNHWEGRMNKKELVESMAGAADISKASAEKALNGMLMAITDALAKGDKVTLVGFGTFSTVERSERKAKNPRTGDMITIPAKTVAKFKPGSKLADAVE